MGSEREYWRVGRPLLKKRRVTAIKDTDPTKCWEDRVCVR